MLGRLGEQGSLREAEVLRGRGGQGGGKGGEEGEEDLKGRKKEVCVG